MTQLKIILILCIFIITYSSCERGYDRDTTIEIYKFKAGKDYSNNVPVELSEDNERITSAPGSINTRWPIELTDNYCLNGSMGVNSGYLSLTIAEYNSLDIIPGVDSLYNLLTEKEPYIEYYRRHDDGTFNDENGAYGIDTALINHLIRTNSLETYFERLK
jgi:hypothetical protein